MYNKIYNKVYDFTNENVSCLKDLYHFENSKVLTVVGSGDQYFSSMLNGAKQVDLYDINFTSYLYFILKFYSIRELTFEEFYDFLIKKNFKNTNIYMKLESVLPKTVLKYYQYIIKYKKSSFKKDGIKMISKKNHKYYFENKNTVIPYFVKDNYYKLQNILKNTKLPNFYDCDIRELRKINNEKYDIILMSNIYNYIPMLIEEYTNLLKSFDAPEIEACYDWYGWFKEKFKENNYEINKVLGSSPSEYYLKENYVYSLKK